MGFKDIGNYVGRLFTLGGFASRRVGNAAYTAVSYVHDSVYESIFDDPTIINTRPDQDIFHRGLHYYYKDHVRTSPLENTNTRGTPS